VCSKFKPIHYSIALPEICYSFLTIHDAIMESTDVYYTAITDVMQGAFQGRYGAVPPIDVEAC